MVTKPIINYTKHGHYYWDSVLDCHTFTSAVLSKHRFPCYMVSLIVKERDTETKLTWNSRTCWLEEITF